MVFCAISLFRKTLLETSYITYVRNLSAYSWLFNYRDALNWNSISDCNSIRNLPKHRILSQLLHKKNLHKTKRKPDPEHSSQGDSISLKYSFTDICIVNIGNFFNSTIIQVTTCSPSDMSIIFHLILFSVFKTHNSLKQPSRYCCTSKDWN